MLELIQYCHCLGYTITLDNGNIKISNGVFTLEGRDPKKILKSLIAHVKPNPYTRTKEGEIMTIEDVLHISEAAALVGCSRTNLRKRFNLGKDFIQGVDCRRSTVGNGDWLVTRESLYRVYKKKLEGK